MKTIFHFGVDSFNHLIELAHPYKAIDFNTAISLYKRPGNTLRGNRC